MVFEETGSSDNIEFVGTNPVSEISPNFESEKNPDTPFNGTNNGNLISGLQMNTLLVSGLLAGTVMASASEPVRMPEAAAAQDDISALSFVPSTGGAAREETRVVRDEGGAIKPELKGFLDLIQGGTLERVLEDPSGPPVISPQTAHALAPAINATLDTLDSLERQAARLSDWTFGAFSKLAGTLADPFAGLVNAAIEPEWVPVVEESKTDGPWLPAALTLAALSTTGLATPRHWPMRSKATSVAFHPKGRGNTTPE